MTLSLQGRKRARHQARSTLERFGTNVPVDVERIARELGLDIRLVEFENEISGMLVVKSDRSVIGVNANHHPNRRRFSMAHELGHYLLHRNAERVFVDRVFFRSEDASPQSWVQEKEANIFAAELLVPERVIRDKWQHCPIDAYDDDAVRELANQFGVSSQALLIRLSELELVFPI